MDKIIVELDWNRLLGFDHVDPAQRPPLQTCKVGFKDSVTPLQAKVGSKQQNGMIGRPQELAVIKARIAA